MASSTDDPPLPTFPSNTNLADSGHSKWKVQHTRAVQQFYQSRISLSIPALIHSFIYFYFTFLNFLNYVTDMPKQKQNKKALDNPLSKMLNISD